MKNQISDTTSIYESDIFSLRIFPCRNRVKLTMALTCGITSTSDIPDTLSILNKHCPDVLTTTCLNETNHSFRQEVVSTEIGHLFEHILLENLCQAKLMSGSGSATFNGRTDWDWNTDPQGVFHITVRISKNDWRILSIALRKTIALTEHIIRSAEYINKYKYSPAEEKISHNPAVL
jgi:hypothetical protein